MFYEILMKLQIVAPIFYKILYMTIIGSIVGLIVYLIRNFFDKKLSGKWRSIMWFIVLATLLIPIRYEIKTNYSIPNNIVNNIEDIKNIPDKQITYHILPNTEIQSQDVIEDVNMDESTYIPETEKNMTEELKKDNDNLVDKKQHSLGIKLSIKYIFINIVIPIIWLIGTLIFIIMLASGVLQIIKKTKKRNIRYEKISNILEVCKAQLNIKKNIKIVLQENGKTSIFGVFKPVILVSKNILEEDTNTIKYIFLHELAHYKRKDSIFNYTLLLTLSIHWFNPVIWFLFFKVREDIELGADELAIEKLNKQEKKEYGLVLINLLQDISNINYTANMLCISDTEKNMERRILMIKGKNKSKIISAIVVIAIIGIIAGIVFIKTEKIDIDVNAGLVSNLNEENYEKVWKEPQKFATYEEYRDYYDNLSKEKWNNVNGEITDEDKNKMISENEAKEKIEKILFNLGCEEKITNLESHKQYVDTADLNYSANMGKNIIIDIDAESGKFLNFYDDSIVAKQLKEDTLNFNEAKKKAQEIYESLDFLEGKYSIYSIVEMQHAYGAGVLDKTGIQYECNQWNATFYENSNPNGLNKYKQLLINFFVSDGKVYITFIKELDKKKMDITLEKSDFQDNPVVITEEKAIEIAKEMDKKISGKEIETAKAVLVNNEVNEYVWLQENSNGEDTGYVRHENEDGSGHTYNQYYYPEKTIRNSYEVKIDYSGEIVLKNDGTPYLGDDSNGNIGRIYYVDCTTGEIIGGRNYGSTDVTIKGEYMENGESRMATKNIFYDVVTGEKVSERNFNYSQEVIDQFMKKN